MNIKRYHRKRKILVLAGFFLLLLSSTCLWGHPEETEPIRLRWLSGSISIPEEWLGEPIRSAANFIAYISAKKWNGMEKHAAPGHELPSANKYLLVRGALDDESSLRSVDAILLLPKSYESQMDLSIGGNGRIPFSGRLIGFIENSITDTPIPIILVNEILFDGCYWYIDRDFTLSGFAEKLRRSAEELKRLNPDVNWDRLYVGQWIRICSDK